MKDDSYTLPLAIVLVVLAVGIGFTLAYKEPDPQSAQTPPTQQQSTDLQVVPADNNATGPAANQVTDPGLQQAAGTDGGSSTTDQSALQPSPKMTSEQFQQLAQ